MKGNKSRTDLADMDSEELMRQFEEVNKISQECYEDSKYYRQKWMEHSIISPEIMHQVLKLLGEIVYIVPSYNEYHILSSLIKRKTVVEHARIDEIAFNTYGCFIRVRNMTYGESTLLDMKNYRSTWFLDKDEAVEKMKSYTLKASKTCSNDKIR